MNILIVDDHELFRFGLHQLLKSQSNCENVFEAKSSAEALSTLSEKSSEIQYIFLDLTLPDSDGCDSINKIKDLYPNIPIVIISAHANKRLAEEALRIGVRGYIPKTAHNQEVCDAVKQIVNGEIFVHKSVQSKHVLSGSVSKDNVSLTQRQTEILQLIDQGHTNYQIAQQLEISENTVRAHASSILNVLKAANRTEACFLARRLGLLYSPA